MELNILEAIENYFLERPRRLITLGRLLVKLGAGLIIVGLFARLATTVAGILISLGGTQGAVKTLSEVYPTLPTWWVPESLVGNLPAMVLIGIGLWLAVTGRRLRRFLAR